MLKEPEAERSPRPARLGAAALAIATLVACSDFEPADVASELAVAPGSLRVTVLRDAAGIPVPNAQVQIVSTTLVAMTTSTGVALFSGLLPGPVTVRVLVIGFCQDQRTANVVSGTVTDLLVWLCTDAVAPAVPALGPIVAVLDIRKASFFMPSCQPDRLIEGTDARASVGTNALTLGPCRGDGWVLTQNHAPHFSSTATDFPWTDNLGETWAPALLPRRLRVPMTVWISDPVMTDAERTALRYKLESLLLPKANTLFAENLAGIRLVGDEGTDVLPEIIDVDALPNRPYDKIGDGCDHVETIKATPEIYQPERFNVYYLGDIMGGGVKGYNCLAEGAPNIIFMDANEADYFTLPHELGHGLGLSRPDWGHSEALEGFYPDAAGWALSIMGRYADAPTYFSVGQVIRMQAEADSWLNAVVGGTSIRSRQLPAPVVTPCGCPENKATPDCPRLNIDIQRAGLPSGPSSDVMACYVKAPVCVSVSAGSETLVTATFHPSATDASPAIGEARVWSQAPAIAEASVVPDSEDGFSVVVRVRGVSAGHSGVRIWASGSYASLEARVGESCP